MDPLISLRGEMIKQTVFEILKLIRRVEGENLNDLIWNKVSKVSDWNPATNNEIICGKKSLVCDVLYSN